MQSANFIGMEIVIPDAELEFQFVRSSGPGGQAVNKVNTKARLRWNFAASTALPLDVRMRFLARYGSRLTTEGDLLITSDRTRDRMMNERDCREKLREMIASVQYAPKPRKKTKPGRGARMRSRAEKQRQGDKKRERSKKSWD